MASKMEQATEEDGLQRFRQRLCEYERCKLRMMSEHFRDELVYIVQILNTQNLLTELNKIKLLNLKNFESMKKDLGASAFSERLVEEVFKTDDALIGFLECLYSLHTSHPHHNLLAVIWEIENVEVNTLIEQIKLDENGHVLDPEIEEIQKQHKKHLEKTNQSMVECKPPGTNLKHQKFEISERFVNLVITSTERFRSRTQHELIEIGEKHESYLLKTQRGLERVSLKRLFRWCRQSQQVPNVIMISGVPGVGKTTLMQKFVFDWLYGKLYQRFSFVFFFKFRELNRLEGKVSLEDIILQQYPHLHSWLEKILKSPERLLFIFDGLDESSHKMEYPSSSQVTNTKHKQKLGMVLLNLWTQTLLKGCSVLVTSRPAKLASIKPDIFQLFCEVMGFFDEERKMYFEQFFEIPELASLALNHVKDNEVLYTFCYIPAYCWIICTVLSMYFNHQKSESLLPKTVTQLFVTFISNILSNHSQETDLEKAHELLLAIGWLAEYGVMNQVIVFEDRHMGSFSVDTKLHLLSSFMVESKQPPYVNYSFLHLTVQEFLAALVHYIDYKPEALQKALDKAKMTRDGRAEIFLRFLFGLSDGSTRYLLNRLSLNFSNEASEIIINWLRQHSLLAKKESKNAWERRETLNIFNYLFESRNKKLVSEILGQSMTVGFSKFRLTPLDCTVLAFVLESCQESECLDLEKCFLERECWQRLSPGLHTVKTLRLNLNELKDDDIHFIANPLAVSGCKIQNLSLTNNELTGRCCSTFASAIEKNHSLTFLDLTFNDLSGPEFRDLIAALSSPTCRVKHLELSAVKLTCDDSQFLVSLSNNKNLEFLNVSHNSITDAGLVHIEELIEKSSSLKEIRVGANGYSNNAVEKLQSLKNIRQDLSIDVWNVVQ